jgi:hypothetical protein
MIVSESYLHFEPLRRRDPSEVGGLVLPLVERAASMFFVEFRDAREAEVLIIEGSIRLKGLIRVAAATLIGFGGIRSGIDYAIHDGKAAAAWINQQVQESLEIPNNAVIARRGQTPSPTQLRRLFESVRSGAMSPEEATDRACQVLIRDGENESTIRDLRGPVWRELREVARLRTGTVKGRASGSVTPGGGPRRGSILTQRPRPSAIPASRFRVIRDAMGRIRILDESGY